MKYIKVLTPGHLPSVFQAYLLGGTFSLIFSICFESIILIPVTLCGRSWISFVEDLKDQ